MIKHSHFLLLLLLGCFWSCGPVDDISVDPEGSQWAIPLINTTFAILDAGENPTDNVVVEIDNEDRIVVKYQGEVLYEDASDIFFPFPILSYFPVLDTVAPLGFPVPEEIIIEEAIFADFTEMRFRFMSTQTEDLDVKVTIPEFTKDGEVFETNVDLRYDGADTTKLETQNFNMDDWLFTGNNNTFFVNYDARTAAGERVKIDSVHMYVKAIHFKFGQGYFGQRNFNIKKDIIEVGIFQKWLSGGFSFEEPKVTMLIENSFGFPVRSIFNAIELTTINDNVFFLESDILMEGIDFNYPSIDEMGEVKYTSFDFTNENSNITEIFNEKTKNVYYDLEAITNAQDENIIGFYNEDSYYKVDIAVEVPMHLRANELVLTDTVDIDLSENIGDIRSLDLVWSIRNAFPINTEFKIVFLDASGSPILSYPLNDWIQINGTNSGNVSLQDVDNQIITTSLDNSQIEALQRASKIAVLGRFNSAGVQNAESIWLTGTQGIHLNVGLKARF